MEETLEVPSKRPPPPPPTMDVVRVVSITRYKNRKSKTPTHSHTLFLRGRMAEGIPIYRRTTPPRFSRLRKKVKTQFSINRATNSHLNGGTGTRMLLTNFNESKVDDYMIRQPQVNVKSRKSMVDWLLGMHCWCLLDDITAFAAVDIFDRFLSVQVVSMEEVNYVGVAAMRLAMKYHESRIYKDLTLDELISFVNGRLPDPDGLHRYRVRIMEKRILDGLGWELDVPTVYIFLSRFLNVAGNPLDTTTEEMAYFFAKLGIWNYHLMIAFPPSMFAAAALDTTTEEMAYFFAKLGIWNYHLMIAFPPSMFAAAALYAACASTCKISMWHHTFQEYTGYKDTQLFKCSKRMLELHWAGHDEKCQWWIPFK